ncbi:MAG TPA: tetratricopeptide repeat protein, partial [Longimicrobium sp.]|uniref:tetratricopeptide repeat protein n=1 Tax=Longimicrobium sp. TaxID=2029185 RepID=UPI002EDA24E6
MPRAPLTPAQRRLLTVFTLALPLLLLALLEAGLRLGGYGGSYPVFVDAEGEPGWMYPNPEMARRYFRDGTLAPLPQMDFFRAERTPRTFRIVFQGESSAAGFPYRHGGAPSRMLRQRLQQTFPDRDVEVVNTALTAVNSYTLLDQAGEIIAQKPDAVMIYTGHNEYYGVFGVGSAQMAGRARWLVRGYLRLSRLRTVQLIRNLLVRAAHAAPQGAEGPRTTMEMMAGGQRIPLDSPRYREGLEHFRANLSDLLERYRKAGIPVLIGTVASNERDQAPFISGLKPGTDSAAWMRVYREGIAAWDRGDDAGAERGLRAALRMDSTSADAWYALGRVYDRQGDAARARTHFRQARERDQLRFRAPDAVNRIIRQEAARHGATVVETERALQAASPGGVIGRSVMLEHLHPNLDGYFVIADAFYNALRQKRLGGGWNAVVPAAQARALVPVTEADSVAGLFRADRLLSGWPFRPRGQEATPVVDTLHARTPAEAAAQEMVRGELPWPEAMVRLMTEYERAGRYAEGLRVARAMVEEYRAAPEAYSRAGQMAMLLGRTDEAAAWARASSALGQTGENEALLGLLALRAGDAEGALRHLREGARLAPGDRRIAAALMAAEELPRTEAARIATPRDPRVLFDLAAM